MKDDGKRLGVLEFGDWMLRTGDLDPLYIALWRSGMSRAKLIRWLICYWCYYSAGLCSWVADRGDFWGTMMKIARSGPEYPRGTERRHFRGKLAETSVEALRRQFSAPTDILDWLTEKGIAARTVCKRVTELRGFGEWIKWKVPDMLERLDLAPVRFVDEDLDLMFKTSKEGAEETCRACRAEEGDYLTAHSWLLEHLGDRLAPPRYDRPINIQETETIFCKWKSHLGGHYPLGKDTREIREGLVRYGRSKTSQALIRGLKEGVCLEPLEE